MHGLAREHTLIRYDARGNGMSDWDVDDISLDAWVSDLECVVEANRVERFPLLGMSQGCSVAVAYAVSSGTCLAPHSIRRLFCGVQASWIERRATRGICRHAHADAAGLGRR